MAQSQSKEEGEEAASKGSEAEREAEQFLNRCGIDMPCYPTKFAFGRGGFESGFTVTIIGVCLIFFAWLPCHIWTWTVFWLPCFEKKGYEDEKARKEAARQRKGHGGDLESGKGSSQPSARSSIDSRSTMTRKPSDGSG
ncbi:MAG: hypothetical protein Q9159_000137 [Coniocarpon cinnabarinum]